MNEDHSQKLELKGKKNALGRFTSVVIVSMTGTQQRDRAGEDQKVALYHAEIWNLCQGDGSAFGCFRDTPQQRLPRGFLFGTKDPPSEAPVGSSSLSGTSQTALRLIIKSISEEEDVRNVPWWNSCAYLHKHSESETGLLLASFFSTL